MQVMYYLIMLISNNNTNTNNNNNNIFTGLESTVQGYKDTIETNREEIEDLRQRLKEAEISKCKLVMSVSEELNNYRQIIQQLADRRIVVKLPSNGYVVNKNHSHKRKKR